MLDGCWTEKSGQRRAARILARLLSNSIPLVWPMHHAVCRGSLFLIHAYLSRTCIAKRASWTIPNFRHTGIISDMREAHRRSAMSPIRDEPVELVAFYPPPLMVGG